MKSKIKYSLSLNLLPLMIHEVPTPKFYSTLIMSMTYWFIDEVNYASDIYW